MYKCQIIHTFITVQMAGELCKVLQNSLGIKTPKKIFNVCVCLKSDYKNIVFIFIFLPFHNLCVRYDPNKCF